MQFVEVSALGVRAAIYRLQHPASCTEFILFPMLHVGSPGYYAAIQERLADCDLILAEGISSRNVALLTLTYHQLAKRQSLDLVTQRALDLQSFGDKVVRPDMTGEEFDKGWEDLSVRLRLLVAVITPIYALYLRLFGAKHLIARFVEINDLPSREEILMANTPLEQLDDLIIRQRDARVVRHIHAIHADIEAGPRVVAVLFGARHMRAIAPFLLGKLGYRVADAQWVMVFSH